MADTKEAGKSTPSPDDARAWLKAEKKRIEQERLAAEKKAREEREAAEKAARAAAGETDPEPEDDEPEPDGPTIEELLSIASNIKDAFRRVHAARATVDSLIDRGWPLGSISDGIYLASNNERLDLLQSEVTALKAAMNGQLTDADFAALLDGVK